MEQQVSEATNDERPTPDLVGYSLANVAELMYPCMEAAGVESVLEIGAYHGALTEQLLGWAGARGSTVTAVDAEPPPPLTALAGRHPELRLVGETSHDAIRDLPRHDAVIIDGDHNYYTVAEELRLLEERHPATELPLLMFHDVAWPHARRDTYYAPDRIPPEHRQPVVAEARIDPEHSGVVEHGLRYDWAAAREGGPANGVLTAIEDFVAAREGLRLAVVPAFFGFGVLWHLDAPWADAVAGVVDPWDANPLVARLEANRVAHLVARVATADQIEAMNAERESLRLELETTSRELEAARARLAGQERVLRDMLESSAFALAEQVSRIRQRGEPIFSRDKVRRALEGR